MSPQCLPEERNSNVFQRRERRLTRSKEKKKLQAKKKKKKTGIKVHPVVAGEAEPHSDLMHGTGYVSHKSSLCLLICYRRWGHRASLARAAGSPPTTRHTVQAPGTQQAWLTDANQRARLRIPSRPRLKHFGN